MLLSLLSQFSGSGFFRRCQPYGDAMARYLLNTSRDEKSGLFVGVPEADEADDTGCFTHNNAWAAAGLTAWGTAGRDPQWLEQGKLTAFRLRQALEKAKKRFGVVPYRLDEVFSLPEHFWDDRKASYANYRYYPELLSSGFLTEEEARSVVALRRKHGGDDRGITTMRNSPASPAAGDYHYDDWTLGTYASGLWHYGMKTQFRECFDRHWKWHTCPDTRVAYEQVTAFGTFRVPYADFCVPSQLVILQMATHANILGKRRSDEED